jgi:hypothetical protein
LSRAAHKIISALVVAAAPGVAVEVVVVPVREPAEIEAAMTQWGRESDGLIVPPDPSTNSRRGLIVELAAHYWLPAISADRRWRDRLAPLRGRHRGRHQAPAYLIVSHNGQQTAVRDDDLFA